MENERNIGDLADEYVRSHRRQRPSFSLNEHLIRETERQDWGVVHVGDFLSRNYSGRRIINIVGEARNMPHLLNEWKSRRAAILRLKKRLDEAKFVENLNIPFISETVNAAFGYFNEQMELMETGAAQEYSEQFEYWRVVKDVVDEAMDTFHPSEDKNASNEDRFRKESKVKKKKVKYPGRGEDLLPRLKGDVNKNFVFWNIVSVFVKDYADKRDETVLPPEISEREFFAKYLSDWKAEKTGKEINSEALASDVTYLAVKSITAGAVSAYIDDKLNSLRAGPSQRTNEIAMQRRTEIERLTRAKEVADSAQHMEF